MNSALIDTALLLDYLHGDKRAQRALAAHAHRCVSVVTWLELMSLCPADVLEPTRGFLRSFERLSVSESIADEAHRLVRTKPGLPLPRALTWATATVNQLLFVTTDAAHVDKADRQVLVAYRGSTPVLPRPRRIAAAAARFAPAKVASA